MNKKQRMWTREEEQFLIDNHDKLSNDELASELDRYRSSVVNKKYRMGLSSHVSKAERAVQIKRLSHLTSKEIAAKIGITQTHVNVICKEYKIDIRRDAKGDYQSYKQFLSNNIGVMTVSDMARELNTSRQNVQNYLYDNRLEVVNDDYALYHNDDLIGVGNLYELSDVSGILPSQLLWHYHNRNGKRKFAYEMIKLEDEK